MISLDFCFQIMLKNALKNSKTSVKQVIYLYFIQAYFLELLLYGSTKAPKMAASLETNLIPFFIELSKADSELRKAIFARLQSLLKPMLKSSLEVIFMLWYSFYYSDSSK